MKILSFCFCTIFLASILLNVYYIREEFPGRNTGTHSLKTTPKNQKVSLKKQCDGTECPGGCCPYQDWFCCPDGIYCADTEDDCDSTLAKKKQIIKMASKKQCDGTECPGGCCPYQDWFCCPDGIYCADTEDDCDSTLAKKKQMLQLTSNDATLKRSDDCDLVDCKDGTCCDNPQFPTCCPEGDFCAAADSPCDALEVVKATNKKFREFW